ncbi:MAG: autotransporter outer membrane beta-barrel domain-containing protein, partial [Planctomycetaceae bacterium]|nr:autotransporter outer membrane beta-barrel domain-containing protein [Planctomycetaceae bacterium]
TRQELEALINPFLVGELAVEANHLAMYKPYLKVFDHIANLSFHTNNTVILGQSPAPFSPFDEFAPPPPPIGIKAQSEFWSASYYTFEKVDDDSYALDYETSQARIMIGYDKVVRHDLLAGFVLGYGNPHISNSVTKIKANDFLVGVYARKRFMRFENIYANVFVGYGYQDYKLSRDYQKTKYDGDSFYASIELSKPMQIEELIVEPLVAFDFQKTNSNGFDVDVNLSKANVPYTNILGQNQIKTLSIANNDFEQAFLRIGLNTSYKRLRTRFQYSYLACGDATANTHATIKGISNGTGTLTAARRGRYIINTGAGIDRNIGEFTKIFADYDFEVGKNINSHTAQLGIVTLF